MHGQVEVQIPICQTRPMPIPGELPLFPKCNVSAGDFERIAGAENSFWLDRGCDSVYLNGLTETKALGLTQCRRLLIRATDSRLAPAFCNWLGLIHQSIRLVPGRGRHSTARPHSDAGTWAQGQRPDSHHSGPLDQRRRTDAGGCAHR